MKLEAIQPRVIRHRTHYKIYLHILILLSALFLIYWMLKFTVSNVPNFYSNYSLELSATGVLYLLIGLLYFFWLRPKFLKSLQVYDDHLLLKSGKSQEKIFFDKIVSVKTVCWSIFYVRLESGRKYYFNSSYERVDYIWEGIYNARSDLIDQKQYEQFRVKLVQYDHHQKRKEWFLKHKLLDVVTWALLPLTFLVFSFIIQSRTIVIHQQSVYFFRLFMYSLLVLLSVSFVFSLILKKLVFDKKVSDNMELEIKLRDLEYEGMILHKSKIFQLVTVSFILGLFIRADLNFFSITKIKDDVALTNMKKGKTFLIDNRYNCIDCRYQLHDGDYIVFGRGMIGQILARQGDTIGEVFHDKSGRMIASENLQQVPTGHIAVRASNGKDIVFVKIEDLIGKIQN